MIWKSGLEGKYGFNIFPNVHLQLYYLTCLCTAAYIDFINLAHVSI